MTSSAIVSISRSPTSIVSARSGTCSERRVNRRKLALLEPSVAPEGGSRVRCGDPRPGRAAAEMEYRREGRADRGGGGRRRQGEASCAAAPDFGELALQLARGLEGCGGGRFVGSGCVCTAGRRGRSGQRGTGAAGTAGTALLAAA